MATVPLPQQVQAAAQPNSGAINNGNPGTVYNVALPTTQYIPPQANAQGQWWAPQSQPMNPMIANIINATYGRYAPQAGGVPLPTTPPPVVTPPVTPPPAGPGQWWDAGRGYWEDMGGDGSYCVGANMILEGSVRASKAVKGLVATTHTPEEGFALTPIEAVSEAVLQPCVKIVTDRGAKLICSVTTPFTLVGAKSDSETVLAPAMTNEWVYVKRGKITKPERVIRVEDVGQQLVIPISFGGKSFPAGESASALIYSHNIRKIPGTGIDLVGLRDGITTQFSRSWGNSPYITTQSQMPGYVPPGGTATPTGTGQTPAPAGTPSTPVDPEAPYGRDANGIPFLPPLPQPQSPGGNFWQSFINQLVPRDADGTIDWQGLLLETVAGPGAGLFNTSGQPRNP